MSKQPNTRNNLTLYLTVALIAHQVFEGELPPLQLDLDDPDGKFVNKPYSYSIDLNLATRMTRAYDVG